MKTCSWLTCISGSYLFAVEPAPQLPSEATMSWLENTEIKVGVDLNRGGAIVYLAGQDGINLINNFDLGRQVQLSYFSGPVPFEAAGQKPKEQWQHIGWNPIQAGDDFGHRSEILAHENDGKTLHVSCRPMQWPLRGVPGECVMESWLALEGKVLLAKARLSNARHDTTPWPARLQELPAVYGNAGLHRVISYQGTRPFQNEPATLVPKPQGKHPWSFWIGTEGWAALLNEQDHGLGLITPDRVHFTGGFAGKPGKNETLSNSTGYLAGQGQEILDHNIVHEFRYELVLGNLKDIRTRAERHQRSAPPIWRFQQDRQGWHFHQLVDRGWPIEGCLHLQLEQPDPQLIGPFCFWQAEEAPQLIVDAAFYTRQTLATVFWQRHGTSAPQPSDTLSFPIQGDGLRRRYVIKLSEAKSYQGSIIRLRLDPVPSGSPGDWAEIHAIELSRVAE
jgi:hypothetical protein